MSSQLYSYTVWPSCREAVETVPHCHTETILVSVLYSPPSVARQFPSKLNWPGRSVLPAIVLQTTPSNIEHNMHGCLQRSKAFPTSYPCVCCSSWEDTATGQFLKFYHDTCSSFILWNMSLLPCYNITDSSTRHFSSPSHWKEQLKTYMWTVLECMCEQVGRERVILKAMHAFRLVFLSIRSC